jgi:hypothetical protein
VQNNERCLAFPPAVSRAFLEVSDLRVNFNQITFRIFLEFLVSGYMYAKQQQHL